MRAYSLDLRKKVIAAYYQTQHKSNVCKQFNIARSTLDEWIQLEKTAQGLQPSHSKYLGRPARIKNFEEFQDFVRSTPFEKVKELIDPFEQKFGYKVPYSIIWRGLKKIGWIRGRNGCWKEKKTNK